MISTTKFIGICSCLCLSISVFAQDFIQVPLQSNPVIAEKWEELKYKAKPLTPTADTIALNNVIGILDDFSYPGPYPDFSIWLDSFVFVNRTYPYAPPTIGVATFDGLNQQGYPYDFTAPQISSRIADYLTSKPIDLNYPASDSIYLSFFYQPQGRGNAPALKDSLVLEFKAPGDTLWSSIWGKPGTSLIFADTLKWNVAIIPITNPKFLQKGFQFRFKNYATVSGSFDHWHIDFVYLNKGRRNTDTVFIDAAIDAAYVYDHPSLIKTYYAMPWRQYTPAFAKSSVTIPFRNNSLGRENIYSAYNIKDPNGSNLYDVPEIAHNVDPFSQVGYFQDVFSSIPAIPLLTGPSTYTARAYITGFIPRNDTLHYQQKFGNYFAYDDGTAESAFGFGVLNTQFAVKFELNVPDTLRYVDIYFNPKLTDATKYTFNLKVWADGGNGPGSELATSPTLTPRYSPQGMNAIIRYGLGQPLALPAGIFYVGFIQNTNELLGVGHDLNTNSQFHSYYNIGQGWQTIPQYGTAILHPVFGSDSTVISVNKYTAQNKLIELYPNPASHELTIRSVDFDNHRFNYSILDMYGKLIETKTIITPAIIDISTLATGVYFIQVTDENNTSALKFIKTE